MIVNKHMYHPLITEFIYLLTGIVEKQDFKTAIPFMEFYDYIPELMLYIKTHQSRSILRHQINVTKYVAAVISPALTAVF